jgi:RimJ/RimL family protein N-acetyltransferase
LSCISASNAAFPLETPRFRLRPLTPDDATPRYASWMRDPAVQRWIETAASTEEIEPLRTYIAERCCRDDVLFLGIFDRESGLHVGNIKFEPIDSEAKSAVLGVLIGESDYRGRGVFGEILQATAALLSRAHGVERILLGVRGGNHAALKAYRASGFVQEGEHTANGDLWMVLHV